MKWRSIPQSLRNLREYFNSGSLEALPLRHALRDYSRGKFTSDLYAGLSVALLAIPQGMAYALIAGLPNVSFGILCSAVAAVVAALFVSSRFTICGPTNATALLTFSVLSGTAAGVSQPLLLLPVLIFIAGLLLIIGAYLRFADLVTYISRSVVVGYITGAACLIMTGQLREVFGIQIPAGETASGVFAGQIRDFFRWFPGFDHWALLLSTATILTYFGIRRYLPKWPAFAGALVVGALLGWIMRLGTAGKNLVMIQPFSRENLLPAVPDLTDLAVLEQVPQLFGPAIALAFLAALEMSVMGKTLGSKSGSRYDANQDLLALGMANVVGSFISAMPSSGSLTRSALNFQSGSRTQLSGLFSGLIAGIGVLLLGGLVSVVPRCSLAALVICIAISLIHPRHLRICLKATSSDATTLIITLLATLLLPLHVAIFIGVATSVVLYLRKASRPMLVEYEFNTGGELTERAQNAPRQNPQISIVHVEGELFFGAAELFRTQIQRTVVDPSLKIIILRMKNARHLDATSVMALEELVAFLHAKLRHLIISGASKSVYRVLRNSGMVEIVGRENIFMGSPGNPNLSTRNALKRAQQLLGGAKADIRIFIDPNKPAE
jgi:SulP family sulfate permease